MLTEQKKLQRSQQKHNVLFLPNPSQSISE